MIIFSYYIINLERKFFNLQTNLSYKFKEYDIFMTATGILYGTNGLPYMILRTVYKNDKPLYLSKHTA